MTLSANQKTAAVVTVALAAVGLYTVHRRAGEDRPTWDAAAWALFAVLAVAAFLARTELLNIVRPSGAA